MIAENDNTFDIVIAGGSFVGLALARALSVCSNGSLRCAVVDPVPLKNTLSQGFDARASALSAASQQMLSLIGVWQDLEPYAQAVTDIQITDSALENVIRPVFLQFDNRIDGDKAATYIVENYRIRAALGQLLQDDASVSLISGCGVQSFERTAHQMLLKLSNGQSLHSTLLIAADGRRSHLRKLAGIKVIGWSYDQMGLVTTVSHDEPHQGLAVQHFLPSGPFARLPLAEGRSSLVWSEKTRTAKHMISLSDDAFLADVQKRFGHDLGDLKLEGPRGSFPLSLQLARSYISDRFALIGDAAHGVHPIAGLGLNIGLRDVAALSEVIIETQRLGLDFGQQTNLERYMQWRRFDAMLSAFVMDSLNRLFSNDFGPLRTIRDVGLGLVNRSTMLKGFFVREAAGLSGDVPRLLKGEMI